MRNFLFLLQACLIFSACSSPRYTYNFDYYDYNSGRKVSQSSATAAALPAEEILSKDAGGALIRQETISASTMAAPHVEQTTTTEASEDVAGDLFSKKYKSMTGEERKAFRKTVKKEFNTYVKATRKGDHVAAANAVKVMDNDLRLAIIFGAVGLTLTLFGGISEAFWVLGVISIVVGVVFLIKWLVRQ